MTDINPVENQQLQHPGIARSRYWRNDVHWYGASGDVDRSPWSHTLAFCLHGASENDDDLYVMVNAWREDVNFEVQEGRMGGWKRAIDTALPSPDDITEHRREMAAIDLSYCVKARSVVVLLA